MEVECGGGALNLLLRGVLPCPRKDSRCSDSALLGSTLRGAAGHLLDRADSGCL